MHKTWYSIEEVPYYFSGSSIKFQGHTGWKIDDLNPIWVRLLGRSQLSNPSDLPCFTVLTSSAGRLTNLGSWDRLIIIMGTPYLGRPSLYWNMAQDKHKLFSQQQYRHQHKLSSQQQYRHQHKLSSQQQYRHQHKLSSQQQYWHNINYLVNNNIDTNINYLVNNNIDTT